MWKRLRPAINRDRISLAVLEIQQAWFTLLYLQGIFCCCNFRWTSDRLLNSSSWWRFRRNDSLWSGRTFGNKFHDIVIRWHKRESKSLRLSKGHKHYSQWIMHRWVHYTQILWTKSWLRLDLDSGGTRWSCKSILSWENSDHDLAHEYHYHNGHHLYPKM